MNQTPSTTAFDVTLADGSRERIDAEKVLLMAEVKTSRVTAATDARSVSLLQIFQPIWIWSAKPALSASPMRCKSMA
jgi:hypothetical protein